MKGMSLANAQATGSKSACTPAAFEPLKRTVGPSERVEAGGPKPHDDGRSFAGLRRNGPLPSVAQRKAASVAAAFISTSCLDYLRGRTRSFTLRWEVMRWDEKFSRGRRQGSRQATRRLAP